MNNTELLSAISNLLDTKLDEKLDARFDAFEKKLDAKLEAKFEEKLSPIYHRLDSLEYRMGNVEELAIATHKTLTENVIPRLDRVEKKAHDIGLILENDIQPRLRHIESCYVDTFKRYVSGIEDQETLQFDVDTLKRTVRRHSMILQKFALLPT